MSIKIFDKKQTEVPPSPKTPPNFRVIYRIKCTTGAVEYGIEYLTDHDQSEEYSCEGCGNIIVFPKASFIAITSKEDHQKLLNTIVYKHSFSVESINEVKNEN